ncbi:acyl-CoA dehydrogenase family protein [Sulfurisphaera ohwakuensis]|uniref:acyl-CoA dehydrogenase family protein n=1 Tax=Sulfurisphaera ohwakuensis TaxID=69656 RepID=UPI0036F2857B
MLLHVEEDEDIKLIVDSLKELLDREWNVLGSKKHEVNSGKILDLFYKLKDLGVFEFLESSSILQSVLINEFVGENLLPGIIATTFMAKKDVPTSVGINYAPELDKAEYVVTPKGIAKVSEVEYVEIKSPDPSVRVYKILSGKWSPYDNFNFVFLNASAQMLGHGTYCLNKTIEYAKTRIAFGKPIGSYQAIKHKLVDDAIGLELARSRYLVDTDPSSFEYSFKKSFRAILDSIQVHGGIGFTTDLDLHFHLKRVVLINKILTPFVS